MEFSGIMRLFIETIRTTIVANTSHNSVFNAIIKATKIEPHSFDESIFEQLVVLPTENQNTATKSKWTFYLPANFVVNRNSNRWRPIVSGQAFELSSQIAAKNTYLGLIEKSPYQVRHRCRSSDIVTRWPGYISFSAHGATCSSAFRSIERQFDLLRGVLELVMGGGTYSHSFPIRPPRKIDLESWMLAVNDAGNVDYIGFNWIYSSFSGVTHRLPQAVNIEEKHIRLASIFKRPFASIDMQNVSYLLEKSLLQFTNAVDQPLPADQLLHLWQAAETITIAARSGGNTEHVCKRFGRHLKYVGITDSDAVSIVRLLARLRNNLVHQGDTNDITEFLISEFKVECSRAIWWLRWRCDDIKTVDRLEWWYSLDSTPDRRLQNCRDIADLILKDRQVVT